MRQRHASTSGNARSSSRGLHTGEVSAPPTVQALRDARVAHLAKSMEGRQKSNRQSHTQVAISTSATSSKIRPGLGQPSGSFQDEFSSAPTQRRIFKTKAKPRQSSSSIFVYGQPNVSDINPQVNSQTERPNQQNKSSSVVRPLRTSPSHSSRSSGKSSKAPRSSARKIVYDNHGPDGAEQQPSRQTQRSVSRSKKSSPTQSLPSHQAKASLPNVHVTNPTENSKSSSQTAVKTKTKTKAQPASSTSKVRRSSSSFLSLFGAKPSKQPLIECTICTTKRPASQTAKLHCCQTTWCHKCLEHVFRQALATPSLFTHPKCACLNTIDLAHMQPIFKHDPRLQRKWTAAQDEQTLATRGTYCPNPRCARWIHPRYIARPRRPGARAKATCRACGAHACARCGAAWHKGGAACPDARDERAFDDLVRARGWQRCPACGRVVERTEGCNHMRCVPACGVEFCYRCGGVYDALHECPRALMDAEDWAGGQAADASALGRPVNVFDYLEPAP